MTSKSELKVVLVVLVALAACEAVTQAFGTRLSLDDQHLSEIPAISSSLAEHRRPRILFLGNSLTRRGVRRDSFLDQLAARGMTGATCTVVYPDDTVLPNWYFLYKVHFFEAGAHPELLVINSVSEWLSDQVPMRPERIAQSTKRWRHVAEVFRHDIHDLEGRASFLLASYSHAVAKQERIKNRMLDRLIPYYRECTRRFLPCGLQEDTGFVQGSNQSTRTYRRLHRLINMLESCPTQVVFVIMPHPRHRELDRMLTRVIEQSSADLIDLRDLLPQVEGHFPDGHHMDPYAADIYSRAVADALADRFNNYRKNH